ncbi:MAG TPA: DUF5682 family protein [Thermomicrobiales bacterium]|nr:DUF5682 family protein [Thermomicrobiales bacterium]
MSVHVFGIRHHGPGCARSLLAALAALAPDIVLVEGPPDAQEVLPLLTHEAMRPPVALLVYAPDAPRHAAFYPFATYSPEWQALRYAAARGVSARFIDLPQSVRIAEALAAAEGAQHDDSAGADDREEETSDGPEPESTADDAPPGVTLRDDPLGLLAEAAGYADHELWWEHQIEQRQDATGLFAGIIEAMAELRAQAPPPEGEEARREAHMRQAIRAARREGYARIAVVCGAWHAPALADLGAAKDDAALLKGLRKARVAATWIPWTNSRLSSRSGYGAGVRSPGWYEHLWSADGGGGVRWVARAAALLRADDLDAPSSNTIEAVRLAEALAALRGLPLPGLAEYHEAIQTALCGGDPAPMRLIRDRLEIGEALGAVPPETPAVPLQRDLEARQRRLRLPPSPEVKALDLDLRDETGRARSRLLHALAALGIDWGTLPREGGGKGTFHEVWQLQWRPELALAVIEANVWGNTIEDAATAALRHRGDETDELPRLTALLDAAILAALPGAVAHLLARVRAGAAVAADVKHLMDALPPLARIARYGDVRETKREEVAPVIAGIFARVLVGLPNACAALDDGAAAALAESIGRVRESLAVLDDAAMRDEWHGVLRKIIGREAVHGLVRGWCCRLLLDGRALDGAELHRLARLALSSATPAAQAAAWIAGVTRGSGLLLLQQDALWVALDDWLRDLAPDTFVELLPLLRRSFSAFQPPERRAMGEKVKRLRRDARGEPALPTTGDDALADLDRARADRVLPVLARILGVERGA